MLTSLTFVACRLSKQGHGRPLFYKGKFMELDQFNI